MKDIERMEISEFELDAIADHIFRWGLSGQDMRPAEFTEERLKARKYLKDRILEKRSTAKGKGV